MAQNDTHVALIILTSQMWGGGMVENFFGPKFVFLRLRRQHPFLHKTKGPTRNPISPTPPLLRRASMSLPPPPPAEQFSGRPGRKGSVFRSLGLGPGGAHLPPALPWRVACAWQGASRAEHRGSDAGATG